MLLHLDTLSWFLTNQSLLLLNNATCKVEKQQIPILKWYSTMMDWTIWMKKKKKLENIFIFSLWHNNKNLHDSTFRQCCLTRSEFIIWPQTAANLITDDRQSDCLDDKEPNKGFCSCRNICSEIKWLIDWLVFNANFSNISTISWHE